MRHDDETWIAFEDWCDRRASTDQLHRLQQVWEADPDRLLAHLRLVAALPPGEAAAVADRLASTIASDPETTWRRIAPRLRQRPRLAPPLALAALLLIGLGATWWLTSRSASVAESAMVTAVEADIFLDGQRLAHDQPHALDHQARVQAWRGSRAAIRLEDGSHLWLEGGELQRVAGGWLLHDGSLLADIRPRPTAPLTISTRLGDWTVIGTRFRLTADATTSLLHLSEGRVRHGSGPILAAPVRAWIDGRGGVVQSEPWDPAQPWLAIARERYLAGEPVVPASEPAGLRWSAPVALPLDEAVLIRNGASAASPTSLFCEPRQAVVWLAITHPRLQADWIDLRWSFRLQRQAATGYQVTLGRAYQPAPLPVTRQDRAIDDEAWHRIRVLACRVGSDPTGAAICEARVWLDDEPMLHAWSVAPTPQAIVDLISQGNPVAMRELSVRYAPHQ